MAQNPYAAPQSQVVSEPRPGSGLLATPKALDMGASLIWLSQGWKMFAMASGTWLLMSLLFGLGYVVMALVPLGGFAIQIMLPIILAGFYLGADRLNFGEPVEASLITAGFSNHPGPLAIIGTLSGLIQLLIGLPLGITLIVLGEGVGESGGISRVDTFLVVVIGVALLMLLLVTAVSLATWFAPMLIVFDDKDVIAAIRLSTRACLQNVGPILLLAMISVLVFAGVVLTLGLGCLVVLPWYCCASYVAYRQIFYGD